MRIVQPLLRFAADRWVAAGRTDPYREWLAEVAELRVESGRGGGLRAAWFAASLAASRPPDGETVARPRAGLLGPAALLLAAPAAGDIAYRATVYSLQEWLVVLAGDRSWQLAVLVVRLAIVAAVAVGFALVGRALGRRYPLCTSTVSRHRLGVTAVAGTVLLGAGVLVDQLALGRLAWFGVPPSPGGTAAGTVLWMVLLGMLVVGVRHRTGRPVVARLWAVFGGLVAIDAAVTVTALPQMLGIPGAGRVLPLWVPTAVLDADIMPLGPGHIANTLEDYATGLAGTLLTTTAFALGYLVASARPRMAEASVVPVAAPRRTAAGWWFALVGGLGWVAGASWLPLAWQRLSHRDWDSDNSAVLFFAQLDIRKVAILVCCCGLAIALRGTGPIWPAGASAAALYAVDVALSRARLPAPVTAVLALAVLFVPLAAVAARHRLRRPGRRYGHATLQVVAIIAGCCACVPGDFVNLDEGPLPVLSTFPLAVALCCGTLSALAGYCVCRARAEAERQPPRWLWVLLVGALPSGLAVLGAASAATGGSTGLLLMLGVAWPATTVLTIGLVPGRRRPARRTRLVVLAVALMAAEPVMILAGVALSLVLDALSNSTWVNIGDGLPIFSGLVAVGAVLAAGHRVVAEGPPASPVPSVDDPLPDDPVPAVPQAR
jgi:hypothetical protein